MVLQDHLDVIKKGEYMETLNIVETKSIIGGSSISGAFLTAIRGCISSVFEIGQTLGGAIRRISTGNLCRF